MIYKNAAIIPTYHDLLPKFIHANAKTPPKNAKAPFAMYKIYLLFLIIEYVKKQSD